MIGGPGGFIGDIFSVIFLVVACVEGIKGLFGLWARNDPRFTKYLLIVLGYIATPFIAFKIGGEIQLLLIVVWGIMILPFALFLFSIDD